MLRYLLFLIPILAFAALPFHEQNDAIFHGYIKPNSSTGQQLGDTTHKWSIYSDRVVTDLLSGAVYTDYAGQVKSLPNVSSTELGYLDGVTSALQAQIDAKSNYASLLVNGVVYPSSSSTVTSTSPGVNNTVLHGRTGLPPNFSSVDINADTSGVAATNKGGLGSSSTPSNGQVPIGDGTKYVAAQIQGTTNQVNVSNGAGSIQLSTPQDIASASSPTFASLILSNPLPVQYGGHGRNSLTNHGVLIGQGTNPIASVAGSSNSFLKGVTGSDPVFASVDLNADTSNTLAATKGGTGNITNTNHGVIVGAGSSPLSATSAGATNTVLHGQGSSTDPSFSSVDLNADTLSTPLAILKGGTAASVKTTAFDNLSPNTTAGDITYFDGMNNVRLAVGANASVLSVDTSLTGKLKWAAASGGGGGTSSVRFTLEGAVVPFTGIDGTHYQTSTQSLTQVNISMLDSGTSGSTTIQVNQYRSGSLLNSATASLSSSSGNPESAVANLSGTLSLLAGDVISVDVNSIAGGTPSDLSVEY